MFPLFNRVHLNPRTRQIFDPVPDLCYVFEHEPFLSNRFQVAHSVLVEPGQKQLVIKLGKLPFLVVACTCREFREAEMCPMCFGLCDRFPVGDVRWQKNPLAERLHVFKDLSGARKSVSIRQLASFHHGWRES